MDVVKIKATFRLIPGNPYYKLEQLHMLWSNKLHKKWVYDSNILIPRTQIQSYAIMFVQNQLTQHKTKTEKLLCQTITS